MDPLEEILKAGLKAGNREVFRNLFLENHQNLVRYSQSYTRDEESSRELVQDVFLEIWENKDLLTIRGTVKSYLFGATYNRSMNWLRSKKIREAYAANPVELFRWLAQPEEPDARDPLLAEAIEKAVNELPEKCREAFTRFVLFGESQEQAASTLGVKVKTIENQVARARKLLKIKLRPFFER